MSMEIRTAELLSKWGLEDGDLLNRILDELGFDVMVINSHDVLVDLIVDHVLPKIENQIEHEVINSHHNPIRLTRVDGIEIDAYEPPPSGVDLRPECVEIPDEVVREYAHRWLAERAAAGRK